MIGDKRERTRRWRTLLAGLLALAEPAGSWAAISNTAHIAYQDSAQIVYQSDSNTVTLSGE